MLPLIPAELKLPVEPLLASIAALTEQIRQADEHVATLADEKYPETKVLRQVKGIGPLISLTYVLTLEDPYRFAKSRTVEATWDCGLVKESPAIVHLNSGSPRPAIIISAGC